MKTRRLLSLLLCLCMSLGLLAGCGRSPSPADQTTAPETAAVPETSASETAAPETTEAPPPDYAALYAEAADRLDRAETLTMDVEITESRTVGTDTTTESITRKVRWQDREKKNEVIHTSDLILASQGSRAAYEQLWSDDVLYAKVKESRYVSREKREDFTENLIPPVMLQAENYGSLSGEGDRILFTEPLAAEEWAMPEDGELLEALASATLRDGEIAACDYEITFRYGGSTIHNTYHTVYQTTVDEDLAALVPANAKGYESLDSVEAALLLYRARLALENASVCTSETVDTCYVEAAAVVLARTDQTHVFHSDRGLMSREEVQSVVLNLRDQSTESYRYNSTYKDGVETWQSDEEEPQTEEIPEDQIEGAEKRSEEALQYYRIDLFPKYNELVDAALIDAGDYFLVEFSALEPLAERASSYESMILFGGNRFFLDNYGGAATKTIKGFAAVEKYTWLPTSLNLTYEGILTVNGTPTSLQLMRNTAFRLYDPDTYEAICDEPAPDEEPETKPTPLFYEVTGKSGEKLYLFGTIHVGDDRTAFLPQTVYDAFDAADALAVEFDTDVFTEQLDEDEALQAQIRDSYVYTDGTVISNHVDSELYAAASCLLKVAGQYSRQSDQMRPFVWSQLIDSFYLSQGRRLTASKGVDNRLMARAREQEKEILSVESGEFQIGMLAGYSDQVQEMMLAQSVSGTRNQALDSTSALFELWCSGDEEAIRERVDAMSEEERAEVDEDDLAIYDEYHQKMEVERNAHMLEVAEGYLKGEQTVFFAVGMAHLLGEGGLVDGLRAAGYTVTPVQTAAQP